jgi:hypothetical protein
MQSITRHQTLNHEVMKKVRGPSNIGFRGSNFHEHKSQSSTDCNSRKVISTLGTRTLGFRECKCQNNHTNKPPKCEKREGGSHTSGFPGFNTKPPYTTTPEFRKVKGCGTTISGFRVSRFRGFKYQTTIHNNS